MAKNFNIWANFKINDQATKALKNIGKAGASLSRQLSFIGKNAGTVIGNLGRLTSPFIALGGAATIAGMAAMVKTPPTTATRLPIWSSASAGERNPSRNMRMPPAFPT